MLVREIRTYELDSSIAESIMLLNMKGYRTSFCCGGHPNDAYIVFDRGASLILDEKRCNRIYREKIKQRYPINWHVDRDDDQEYYKKLIIRRKNFTEEEILMNTDEQLMDMVAKELKDWVDSLPYLNIGYNRVLYEIINISNRGE